MSSKIFATVSPERAAAQAALYAASLERAARFLPVFQAPTDLVRRRVLADWLLEQGDPHGEFISVQFETTRKARLRAGKLLHRYRTHFLGPLARWVEPHADESWTHGFLSGGVVRLPPPLVDEPALATLTWARVPSGDAAVFASPWLKQLKTLELPTALADAARQAGHDVRVRWHS
jgi:uncharacterized protein (TIGR02996 family)